MTPVFIFSTPRAGSTLLQRILACHQKIATTSEPWILLPLLSMTDNNTRDNSATDNVKENSENKGNNLAENVSLKNHKSLANYSYETSTKAINNFANNITEKANKNKTDNYNTLIANFALSLYQACSENDEEFFIDKTPRYYYIIDEIIKTFPKAKFIFLFRNPLQTYASVLNTWNKNSFYKLYRNRDDLYLAPKLLASAYEKHKSISLAINYDNLVNETNDTLKTIFDYLSVEQLTAEEFDLSKNTFTKNEMGDIAGQDKYPKVSTHSLNNWHSAVNNPIRKWYLKRYLTKLGPHVESTYGYSASKLKYKIDSLPSAINSTVLHDLAGIIYYKLVYKYKLNLLFSSKHNSRKLNSRKYESRKHSNKASGYYD
jgi:hypothetical protein